MESPEQAGIKYYRSLIRLNSQILGLVFGLILGFFIFVATNWLVIKEDIGIRKFLHLLGQYLPGYNVSFLGSIIGFIYGLTIGTIVGSSIDRAYKLLVKSRIIQPNNIVVRLLFGEKVEKVNKKDGNVYRFNKRILGLELGLIIGLSIFIATNWLIIKGGHITPSGDYVVGPHLKLLSQFFIGYRVSFLGSIIGFAYGLALGIFSGSLIGWIYNKIVDFRNEKSVT
jgi:hypothetical protein